MINHSGLLNNYNLIDQHDHGGGGRGDRETDGRLFLAPSAPALPPWLPSWQRSMIAAPAGFYQYNLPLVHPRSYYDTGGYDGGPRDHGLLLSTSGSSYRGDLNSRTIGRTSSATTNGDTAATPASSGAVSPAADLQLRLLLQCPPPPPSPATPVPLPVLGAASSLSLRTTPYPIVDHQQESRAASAVDHHQEHDVDDESTKPL
jgi:hypothetical protein